MRVLAGLVMALVVLVAVAALAGPQGGGKAEEASKRGGGEPAVPRVALNYAGNHTTLWGKVAALAHYDVVKASEPLTCTDGVANFTCLLAKTDVRPILNALGRVGVNATVAPLNVSSVAVAVYNFTAGRWQWWNVTVLKAWNVTSQHGWAVIVQAPLKKSLGEMMKIHDKAVEKLFKMKNVTAVVILTHRLIVGTSNATDTGEEGQGGNETAKPKGKRPDPATVERIKKAVKEIDPDVEVEVIYSEPAQPLAVMGGSFPISITWRSDGTYKYRGSGSCTLGYAGWLYGDPTMEVIVTAWHCFAYVGTDRTTPFSITVAGSEGGSFSVRSDGQTVDGIFVSGPYSWRRYIVTYLYVYSDVAIAGRSSIFTSLNIVPGYVTKADGYSDLPVVAQLGKYDVKVGDTLHIRLGRSNALSRGTVNSLCDTSTVSNSPTSRFVPVHSCHVLIGSVSVWPQPGDSGSPVYVLVYATPDAASGVRAYGVLSGSKSSGIVVATLDFTYVKLTR